MRLEAKVRIAAPLIMDVRYAVLEADSSGEAKLDRQICGLFYDHEDARLFKEMCMDYTYENLKFGIFELVG